MLRFYDDELIVRFAVDYASGINVAVSCEWSQLL